MGNSGESNVSQPGLMRTVQYSSSIQLTITLQVRKRLRHYRGQCDYFAVYCEQLNKVYLIPVDQVGTTRAHLRLVPAKNNQEKNVRWAKDYAF